MNSQQATARRIGMALIAACSVLLTSCAAGQHAATARQTPPIDGVNGTIGNLEIRALAIVAPPGGETSYQAGTAAELTVSFVNNSRATDTLTNVTTPAAKSWGVFDDATAAAAATASPSATASSASGSATARPAGSPSATVSTGSAAPAGVTSVDLPSGVSTAFGTPSAKRVLLLLGLTDQLYPASSVTITFTFAKAGSLTLVVPVQLSTSPAESTIPAPTSGGE